MRLTLSVNMRMLLLLSMAIYLSFLFCVTQSTGGPYTVDIEYFICKLISLLSRCCTRQPIYLPLSYTICGCTKAFCSSAEIQFLNNAYWLYGISNVSFKRHDDMNWNHTLWDSEKYYHLRSWISCWSDVKNLIDVRGVELTDIIVQPWDSGPSFQVVRHFYINARWKVNKYKVKPILAMKACGGMNCSSIHCFLTSELDGIEWTSPCFEKRAFQHPLITRLFSPYRRSFWRQVSCPFRKSNRIRARSDSNFSTVRIASQGA